ncbi:hypothetical protein ACLBXI_07475 [Bacillus cereus]
MKYKNRLNAKRKYKQALLATVTTMTLGTSALGGATSAFAAETTTSASTKSTDASTPYTNEKHMGWGDFQKWVLDENSSNIKTVIKDVRKVSSDAEPTVVFTEDHQNPTNQVMPWKPAKKSKSFTDTTSISTIKEFTVGTEIEVSIGEPNVAGIKGKLSFSQKLGTTKTELHSETALVEIDPTVQQIPANETYRCTGIITKDQYTGTLENVSRLAISSLKGVITDQGIELDFEQVIPDWNQMSPKQQAYYGLKAYYELVRLNNPKDVWMPKEQLLFKNGDTYQMSQDNMDKILKFNNDEKQVYNIKESTEFQLIGGYHSNWQVTNSKGNVVGY